MSIVVSGLVTAMTPALYDEWGDKKFGSVGKPFGGAQLRVVDPQTRAVLPPGQEGLLEVMAPRIGEGGAIPPPAAIGNAVNDALSSLGAALYVSPITPRRVLEAIAAAKGAE